MTRARIGVWLSFLGQLLLVPVILLYVCEWSMLDEGYHMQLHRTLGAARATGLTEDGVESATHTLVEYLRGRRDSIDLQAPVYGTAQEVFNAREKAHMVDVKALFDGGRRIRAWLFALGGLMVALGAMLAQKARAKRCNRARLTACCVWIGLLGALALVCLIDFNAVFLRFHALFFDNDLWMLDPRTDLMIRLLPEPFFAAVASRTALWMGIAVLAIPLASWASLWIWGDRTK